MNDLETTKAVSLSTNSLDAEAARFELAVP